jgi:adenosylcobinamide kinase/adenosylcobinamide-phosphate guanylyltransferase
MGRIIMVTGGARSGKSTFAEKKVSELSESVLYIATSIAFDDEMKDRIRKHREQRPKNWKTHEGYKGFGECLPQELSDVGAVILDCLTLMVSNIMLERAMDWENTPASVIDEAEAEVRREVEELIGIAQASSQPFVIVTNELGMGVVPPTVLGRAMRDIAGRANQMLAASADEVYLCVSGIPVKIK